ncbi:hypothetical protein [Frigoriglobus tundricola]|uniref:Uncharacterized protein n=1 Tax=Frigoriglobus tundricola TaxID=2774151 RepID=A0A6M5YJF9_9BACT|nr:hypothetical protein [Frigoriglobus tundricola]QJW93480.1 hypothetical protein FTUN_0986 [Frigoriglobus tundricola]
MRFVYWSREVAGWLLVLIGLWQFWNTYTLLTNRRILEAAPSAFIAFVIFRGGVHLLKVAVAAQAARTLPESSAQPATRRAGRMPTKPIGPTPAKAVVPGPRSRAAAAAANGDLD